MGMMTGGGTLQTPYGIIVMQQELGRNGIGATTIRRRSKWNRRGLRQRPR